MPSFEGELIDHSNERETFVTIFIIIRKGENVWSFIVNWKLIQPCWKGEKISDDFDKDYHLYFIHKNQHDRSV